MSAHSDLLSQIEGRSVLVTGAGGFIGSHLTETLQRLGAHVTAFVRYTSRAEIGALQFSEKSTLEKINLFFGDLRDPEAVREAVKDQEILFHLGAVISVPYSFIHPFEVVETNILGTLNVLQAARLSRPEIIVHLSTSEVYGTAQYVPIDEFHPKRAQSPYAASKIGADELARSFYLAYNLPVVIVRPFNTFGPRQSQRAVISTITVQALKEEEVMLGHIDSIRDFVFVKDTVRGLIMAALRPKAIGEEIQLATGSGHKIRDVAMEILEILGIKKNLKVLKERMRPGKSEVQRLIGSVERAKRILGWDAEIPFKEGLRETVGWIKRHLDFYEREVP